jgi:predicted DNA-binding transcriptional regulator YafY
VALGRRTEEGKMARGEQLGRQWRIIQTLISCRTGKSAADLASELECNPRTVYRDLEALQIAGFPIYTEKHDGRSLWSLLDTVKHQIPVPFTMPELMALYFSGDMLEVFRGTMFHDSLESLFRKIKTTLPPESLKYLQDVEQTLHLEIRPFKEYERFREIISRVNDAAVKKRRIDMVYYTMSRKKETRRKVDPYRVWFFNGSFYMIGYCHLRGEVRVFALDRIKMLHQTKEIFEVPDDFSFKDFTEPGFGVFRGKPVKVRVWFSPEVAGYVKEKIWHESQEIHLREDGSIIFQAVAAETVEIKAWVMSWGSQAMVLEPESLRNEIRAETRRLLGKYEKETKADGIPVRVDK